MTESDTEFAKTSAAQPGLALRGGLWLAQIVISFLFCYSGYMKLMVPLPVLAKMGMIWPSQVSPAFLTFIGLVDMAGGIGILLPALTRIKPRLTVLAALGCSVLQVLAILFHVSRGEFSVLPLNVVLLALSLFVLWGRGRRAPIVAR